MSSVPCAGLRLALLFACANAAFAITAMASNDNAGQIEALCASLLADEPAAQAACRERQHLAAADLMDRIELAAPGSREFEAASACIERAKVAQPAQIDWPKALRCYENRTRAGGETQTSTP